MMKTAAEIQEILFASLDSLREGQLDKSSCDTINQLGNKITDIHRIMLRIKKSPGKYLSERVTRITAAGDRISSAIDIQLRGNITADEHKEIKAAIDECVAAIHEIKM